MRWIVCHFLIHIAPVSIAADDIYFVISSFWGEMRKYQALFADAAILANILLVIFLDKVLISNTSLNVKTSQKR